jgi:hypothetical protein
MRLLASPATQSERVVAIVLWPVRRSMVKRVPQSWREGTSSERS